MDQRTKALVWFTGVISKFNLSDSTLDNLQFNTALLNKLKETHDLVFLIMYPDEDVKQKYLEAIADARIKDNTYIFAKYEHTDSAEIVRRKIEYTLRQIFEQHTDITKYVDTDRSRMNIAANYVINEQVFHLSQFLT